MKRNYFLVGFALLAATLVATAIAYPHLPDMVPAHWDAHGAVDHFSPKWRLFLDVPVGIAGILGLFALLPWLSPKRFEVDTFRSTYLYIMLVIAGLFVYMHGVLLYSALTGRMNMNRAILCGVCLLYALLGNVLGKVRRNFYIGIRTPWTIANETVWNATHRLAGRLFFVCGVTGMALAFLPTPLWLVVSVLAAGPLASVVYSLVFYKQLERRGEV